MATLRKKAATDDKLTQLIRRFEALYKLEPFSNSLLDANSQNVTSQNVTSQKVSPQNVSSKDGTTTLIDAVDDSQSRARDQPLSEGAFLEKTVEAEGLSETASSSSSPSTPKHARLLMPCCPRCRSVATNAADLTFRRISHRTRILSIRSCVGLVDRG